MRGFAFIGGEGPEPAVELYLSEADVIVAADSGLAAVEARGLRADWVVGDMDSLEDRSLLDRYPVDRVRAYPQDKDDTDTEIALSLLSELGCSERVLVGGGGGRLDHLLAIASLFDRDGAPDRWITRNEDCFLVSGGGALEFQAASGALVSVFPRGEGPWTAGSDGLRWPLDGLRWKRGLFGVSNRASAASARIVAEAGSFLVILPIGTPARRV